MYYATQNIFLIYKDDIKCKKCNNIFVIKLFRRQDKYLFIKIEKISLGFWNIFYYKIYIPITVADPDGFYPEQDPNFKNKADPDPRLEKQFRFYLIFKLLL